jgi:hypothetical protein
MSAQMEHGTSPAMADITPQMRLQILTTEHSSLNASRALAWNESFSRAGMFLAILSGSLVALALVGQGSAFGTPFFAFALVLLPVVLFVGIATFLRLRVSNYHDARCVIGMNRIRHAYLELVPDLEPYFVTSANDDRSGVERTMAIPPQTMPVVQVVSSTATVIGEVNAVIAGAFVALLAVGLHVDLIVTIALGTLTFLIVTALHVLYGQRAIRSGRANITSRFPSLQPPATGS